MEDDYQVYISDVDGLIETFHTTPVAAIEGQRVERDVYEVEDIAAAQTKLTLVSGEQRLWTALVEPPDINYKEIIETDETSIGMLFEDETLHFEKRCLQYRTLDLTLEVDLLRKYEDQIRMDQSDISKFCSETEESFLEHLMAEVIEDNHVVVLEWHYAMKDIFDWERRWAEEHPLSIGTSNTGAYGIKYENPYKKASSNQEKSTNQLEVRSFHSKQLSNLY